MGGVVMGDQGPLCGCRGRSARTTSANASAPGPARRGAPAVAGAGRWTRLSLAPGPARSGCGTRRAPNGSCAAPTPPTRPRRGWWRSRRTSEDQRPATLASWTPRGTSPRCRLARRPRPRCGTASCCNGPALERSGRGAAAAQQVTWSMAMTAPRPISSRSAAVSDRAARCGGRCCTPPVCNTNARTEDPRLPTRRAIIRSESPCRHRYPSSSCSWPTVPRIAPTTSHRRLTCQCGSDATTH
jgi:hypothetical protein